jgi:hypothetical protein
MNKLSGWQAWLGLARQEGEELDEREQEQQSCQQWQRNSFWMTRVGS